MANWPTIRRLMTPRAWTPNMAVTSFLLWQIQWLAGFHKSSPQDPDRRFPPFGDSLRMTKYSSTELIYLQCNYATPIFKHSHGTNLQVLLYDKLKALSLLIFHANLNLEEGPCTHSLWQIFRYFQSIWELLDSVSTCSSSPWVLHSDSQFRVFTWPAHSLHNSCAQLHFWVFRTKVNLSKPSINALLADAFNCTPCRNSGSNRETIETNSLYPSDFNLNTWDHIHNISKHMYNRKQTFMSIAFKHTYTENNTKPWIWINFFY